MNYQIGDVVPQPCRVCGCTMTIATGKPIAAGTISPGNVRMRNWCCRPCRSAYSVENREHKSAYNAAYRRKNRDACIAREAAYREKNRDACLARATAYSKTEAGRASRERIRARYAQDIIERRYEALAPTTQQGAWEGVGSNAARIAMQMLGRTACIFAHLNLPRMGGPLTRGHLKPRTASEHDAKLEGWMPAIEIFDTDNVWPMSKYANYAIDCGKLRIDPDDRQSVYLRDDEAGVYNYVGDLLEPLPEGSAKYLRWLDEHRGIAAWRRAKRSLVHPQVKAAMHDAQLAGV